jgi:hypothetical protein
MPEICRFYGIVIKMYFADHQPPHFHAEYAEHDEAGTDGAVRRRRLRMPQPSQFCGGHAVPRLQHRSG